MSLITFCLILSGVLLNALAQLLLKAGTNSIGEFKFSQATLVPTVLRVAFEPYILGGLACYVVSLVIWIVALSKTEVSVAYPMLSIGYVVNAIAAAYLFGEMITDLKLIGLLTIIIGVYLIARG